jgi:hypothetical protein
MDIRNVVMLEFLKDKVEGQAEKECVCTFFLPKDLDTDSRQ